MVVTDPCGQLDVIDSVFIQTFFSVKYFHRIFLELLNNPSFFMLILL